MALAELASELGSFVLCKAGLLREVLPSGALERLAAAIESPAIVSPTPDFLSLIYRIRAEINPEGDFYVSVTDALLDMHRQLTPERWRVPRLFQHESSVIVTPQQKILPHEIVWDEQRSHKGWWHFSDEVSHPYHFWSPAPQDALLALGSFQGYNLLNANTKILVRVDFDARQLAQGTLFRALCLISDTPEDCIGHFLNLWHPDTRTLLLDALNTAERSGLAPDGRTRFFWELARRQGKLSLDALYESYLPSFEKLKQGGEDLSDKERANFDWILDPDQFALVRDWHRTGRVVEFQADVFDRDDLRGIGDFLRERGHQITTFYLSDPTDVVVTDRMVGQKLKNLERSLKALPFHRHAILQWTCYRGAVVLTRPELRDSDPVDGRYQYLEVPLDFMQRWLRSLEEGEGGHNCFNGLEAMLQGHTRIVNHKIIVGRAGETIVNSRHDTIPKRLADLHRRRAQTRRAAS